MSEVLLSLATSLLDSSEITTGTSDGQYLYFDEVNTVDVCSSLCCDITMSKTCDLISNTEMTANSKQIPLLVNVTMSARA